MANYRYRIPILLSPKKASDIPAWNPDALLFMRCNWQTASIMRAVTSAIIDEHWWTGTQAEIDQALEAISQQISEPLLTQGEVCGIEPVWGAEFRTPRDEGGGALFQVRQGFGLPSPPWEFRMRTEGNTRYIEYRSLGSDEPFTLGGTIKEE